MKIITIHDTNILIDLIELDLLPSFFNLSFEFHTTDFVFDEITKSVQKQQLRQFKSKFVVKGFNTSELLKLAEVQNTHRALSIEDISVMELSGELKGILCTADKRLKNVAESRGVEVHGVLWIVEKLVEQDIIDTEQALKNLEKLKIINSRLSHELIDRQINKLNG